MEKPFVTSDRHYFDTHGFEGISENFDAIVYDASKEQENDSRFGIYAVRDAEAQVVPVYDVLLSAAVDIETA